MKEKNNTSGSSKKRENTLAKGENGFIRVMKAIWHYIYMFRAVIISLPVLAVAIWQAFVNASRLPEMVGINLLATGEYATIIPRTTAVLIPLLVTVGCILLTCFSKRILFPWLISAFTLVLPWLIWITNIYPA